MAPVLQNPKFLQVDPFPLLNVPQKPIEVAPNSSPPPPDTQTLVPTSYSDEITVIIEDEKNARPTSRSTESLCDK